MNKFYKYESDVLAVNRGLDACVPVEVMIRVRSLDQEHIDCTFEIEKVSELFKDGETAPIQHFKYDPEFSSELAKEMRERVLRDLRDGTIYQEWREYYEDLTCGEGE